LAQCGERDAALAMLDACLARAKEVGSSAYSLGAVYETGARIAIHLQDLPRFNSYFEGCSAEFEKANNPIVTAKLASLLDLARDRGLLSAESMPAVPNPSLRVVHDVDGGEYETIHSRMAECVDGSDRGRCALTLLLQDTMSSSGLLYTTGVEHGPMLLASLPEELDDLDMARWLERYVSDWTDNTDLDDATQSSLGDTTETGGSEPPLHRHQDRDGQFWQAIPLVCDRRAGRALAGVFIVQVGVEETISLPMQLLANIARELLEHGDSAGRRAD
jgi:hypothetical protein